MNEPHLAGLNDKIAAKEFFERILQEREKTEAEREKRWDDRLEAAERALKVAEQEREKAASALRDQLTMRIESGDKSLTDHVTAQVAQLRQMVEHGERLAGERSSAQEKAVDKALDAQKAQAKDHNDLLRKMERKDETYATKEALGRAENTLSRLLGGLVLASLAVPLLTALVVYFITRSTS